MAFLPNDGVFAERWRFCRTMAFLPNDGVFVETMAVLVERWRFGRTRHALARMVGQRPTKQR
jgi:hypothetical protein